MKTKTKVFIGITGIFLLAFCLAVTLPDYKITIEKIENKLLSFVSADTSENNWTIEGDLVYFEDSNAFLSAYPHTVSSSQWVYFNLTSYNQSGNIDAVWGFKGDSVKPKRAELYKPHYVNWTTDHSKTFLNVSAFNLSDEPCDYGDKDNDKSVNITYQVCEEYNYTEMESECLYWNTTSSVVCYDSLNSSDTPNYTAYWETKHSRLENWIDISNKFTSKDWNYQNMTKWWLLKNVTIQKDINYQVRAWVDVPISFNGVNGKYFWAVKPTNMDLSTAKDKGYFYALDPWFNSSWQYKKNITINHSKVDQSQTNFPVLINLTDTDLITKAQADGDDIVFTNSTGSQLDHEIEYFNGTDGRLVAWVRIPTLSNTTDTVIQMYYGNAGASNQENAEGVWDDNFVMVQHMQETPAGTTYDSTSNNNDGTTYNMDSADQVAGQVDGSLDFDGSDDYVTHSSISFGDAVPHTYSAWVKWNSSDPTSYIAPFGAFEQTINTIYTATTGGGKSFIYRTSVSLRTISGVDTTILYDGGLHHLSWTVTSDRLITVYTDGVFNADDTEIETDMVYSAIGMGYAGSFTWNGIIDEVRISNVARTAGWIATEYNNQISPDSFYSVGGEEEESAEDTTDPTYSNTAHNTTIAGNSINFSIDWNDNSALNPNGQYIFSTNNSGSWTNESAVNFTSTPQSVSVVKTLNSTVGLSIGYRWYGTDNASNSADTGIQSLTTTGADTCSCPGLATNWEISLADYCNITTTCNISTGNLTFINNGSVLFNATLTANQIDFKDSVGVVEEYNLGSNFRGWVG